MKTCIINSQVYYQHRFVKKNIIINDGLISLVDITEDIPSDSYIIDASGKRTVPGFIDIHTHGADGVDVNAATADDLEKICRFNATKGTTSWLCSILTDTKEQTLRCIDQFKKYQKVEHNGSELMGIHLEGPFLSPDYKGAMPESLLIAPDVQLIKEYQAFSEGYIRYITISPELSHAIDIIPELRKLGITVAIGHSGADYDTACQAIKSGAESCTHMFNALKLSHQHFPAITGAVLESDIYCELICDGRHVHPGMVRLLLKTKGYNKVIAITDSIMAAGLKDGNYKLGVNDIVVKDGDAQLKNGGGRAGSTLTQDIALKNLLSFTNAPIESIIPLLTENPAKLLKIYDHKGSIDNGKDADLVILEDDACINKVFAKGKLVYSNN